MVSLGYDGGIFVFLDTGYFLIITKKMAAKYLSSQLLRADFIPTSYTWNCIIYSFHMWTRDVCYNASKLDSVLFLFRTTKKIVPKTHSSKKQDKLNRFKIYEIKEQKLVDKT